MPESSLAIRSIFLQGPAGRLEALLNQGSPTATHAALVCHPHPRYGGTMHNKVVFHAMKALNGFGFPVLRFNFRGTGLSHGEHDHARGEVEDVRTALHWLRQEYSLPIVFAGFSFGAAVGLRAACPDSSVAAIISVGTPVAAVDERGSYDFSFLRECGRPKLFLSGSLDEFAPRDALQRLVMEAAPPKKLVLIEGADHFFAGRLAEFRAAIEVWVRETLQDG
jgi:alpha/beta superfamily hydrolase